MTEQEANKIRKDILKASNNGVLDSFTCILCTEKDKMYSFKVSDYTTEIVGRKNEEGNFFYIQRGDGAVHKYDAGRVTQATELNYR